MSIRLRAAWSTSTSRSWATSPKGGGHRVHGRQLGKHHSQADKAPVRAHSRHPRHGYGYLHAAVDDHSRLA
jgi:hypothetical protein